MLPFRPAWLRESRGGGGEFVTEAVFGRIVARLRQGLQLARCLNEDAAGGVLCRLG